MPLKFYSQQGECLLEASEVRHTCWEKFCSQQGECLLETSEVRHLLGGQLYAVSPRPWTFGLAGHT